MRIPDFIPIIESERKKRERAGVFIETLVWGYIATFLVKILVFSILLPMIEYFAYVDEPSVWALNFVQNLQYDSRYFELSWTALIVTFILGALVGFSVSLTGKGFGHWIASISKLNVNKPEDSLRIQKYWKYAKIEGLIVLLITIITGWVYTEISFKKIFEIEGLLGAGRLALQLSCGIPGVGAQFWDLSIYQGLQSFLNFFIKLHNLFFENQAELFATTCEPNSLEYFGQVLNKLVESVYLAFMATFFSVPIAFILSFYASRNLTRHSRPLRIVYMLVRSYMNITRSIEPLIWAILFSVWIGIGPFAGALALMIHSISSLIKQYSEAVEGVEQGPIEAIQATGANRIAIVWFAVVPQVILPYLAFTIYRWDINVRMATIIGLVGGGGIGGILIQEQMLARWTQVGSIAFLIFLIVWVMDFLSARIREAIG
ncbi:MAG: phosphonate ABC transporter, permease protein PhnE [Silvanigrellaceae bacterium]|nr:phosphonate ABC transporter, permease protein PhnE [Silvanigrellaceae bacterium]